MHNEITNYRSKHIVFTIHFSNITIQKQVWCLEWLKVKGDIGRKNGDEKISKNLKITCQILIFLKHLKLSYGNSMCSKLNVYSYIEKVR